MAMGTSFVCLLSCICLVHTVLQTAGHGQSALNVYTTVNASASSEAVWLGVRHVAQWAVEGSSDTSWSKCFVSDVESSPWWRLSLQSDIIINNVKVFKLSEAQPALFDVYDDSEWEVFVSSGSQLDKFSATQCAKNQFGDPSTVDFSCASDSKGSYLFIAVNGSVGNEKSLALCEVVINVESVFSQLRDIGAVAVYGSSGGLTTVANSSIDNDVTYSPATCLKSAVNTNPWLRIDLQRVYLIDGFRVYPYELDTSGSVIVVGRFPTTDVVSTFYQCGTISYKSVPNRKHLFFFTKLCSVKQLAEYIYLVKTGSATSIAVCEVIVQFDIVYNIYSSTKIAVSSQAYAWTDPWKAIDGYMGVTNGCCFQSASEPNSWWRLEFPSQTGILAIGVLTMRTPAMDGLNTTSVFIGNMTGNNGRDNVQCDCIWSPISGLNSTVTYFHCGRPVMGHYLYIVSDNRTVSPPSGLTLCEIEIYPPSCRPTVSSTTADLVIAHYDMTTLTCRASGCIAVALNWMDPQGVAVMPSWVVSNGSEMASVIEVNGTDGGVYTCIASSVLGVHSMTTTVRVIPHIISVTPNQSLSHEENTSLSCVAIGYPLILITWTDPNGNTVQPLLETTEGNVVNSTIKVEAGSYAEGGGRYECRASNEIGVATTSSFVSVSAAIVRPPIDHVLSHGQRTVLVCTVVGFPIPRVVWRWRQAAINIGITETVSGNSVTSRLDIVQTGAEAGGEYTCEGSNAVTRAESRVVVYVTPVVVVSPVSQTILDGRAADVLQCVGSGYPLPSLTWQWSSIPSDPTVTATYTVRNLAYTVRSNLTVGLVMLSHNNTVYSCNASNSVGTRKAIAHITVTSDIAITENPKDAISVVGSVTQLSCTASGVSATVVRWKRDNFTLASSSKYLINLKKDGLVVTSNLTITDTQLADSGSDYYCEFGSASVSTLHQSTNAAVLVLGRIESFPDRILPSNGSSLAPLMCTFTASPQPIARLLFNNITLLPTTITLIDFNTWRVSTPLRGTALQAAGTYTCHTSYNTTLNVSQAAQLRVRPVISGRNLTVVVVKSGSNVSLTCHATGFPVPSITWNKEELEVIPLSVVVTIDPLARVVVSDLPYQRIGVEQAGLHSCVAVNDVGQSKAYYVIEVPAEVTTPSQSVSATWNGNLSLTCEANGYPAPTISWLFRGINLSSVDIWMNKTHSVNTLHLKNLTAVKHGGMYTCKAMNKAGPESSSVSHLIFVSQVTSKPQSRTVNFGDSVQFSCQVSAYPSLTDRVVWYKDGRPVDSSLSTNLSRFGGIMQSSTLTVNDVSEMDCGVYKCYNSSANLFVFTQIVKPPTDDMLTEGNTLLLNCTSVGCPPANITWHISTAGQGGPYRELQSLSVSKQNGSKTSSVLTIPTVTRMNTNYYRCEAYNGIGRAVAATAFVTVLSPPTIVQGPSSILAFNEDFVKLTCFVSGVPSPMVTWLKDGQVVSDETLHEIEVNNTLGKFINGQAVDLVSTLSFRHLLLTDEGTYGCHANNSIGQALANATLTVEDTGNAIFHCSDPPQIWPLNCSDVSDPFQSTVGLNVSPNVLSPNTNASRISIYWNGWTCFRPSRCTNLCYLWSIYSFAKPHGREKFLVAPRNSFVHIQFHRPAPLQVRLTAGLHLVELKVLATNLTSAVNRQIVLVDDNSDIVAMPGSMLRLSANPATSYKWFTNKNLDIVNISWGSGYYSTYIRSNPWLLYRITGFSSGNNMDTPPLSFSGTATFNNSGISKYTVSLYEKNSSGDTQLVTKELNNFTLTFSYPTVLVTNRTYYAELIVEDIFRHKRSDTVTAYSDFTSPEIGNISVWQRSHPSISDQSVCARTSSDSLLSLEFETVDEESGIDKITWHIGSEGKEGYQMGTISPTVVAKELCHPPLCWCSLDGRCALQQFMVRLGSLPRGMFSVLITAYSHSGQNNSRNTEISMDSVKNESAVLPLLQLVKSESPTTLSVTWSVKSAVRSIVVVCQRPTCKVCQESVTTDNKIIVGSLEPHTDYVIQVRSEMRDGQSGLSASRNVTTQQAVPVASPQNMSISARNATTVLLTWMMPSEGTHNGIIQNYRVDVFAGNSTRPFTSPTVPWPTHNKTIENLNPYRMYRFSVAASTAAGFGPSSKPVSIRMPEAAPGDYPQNVTLLSKTAVSLTLGWMAPPVASRNGMIRGYIVEYVPTSGGASVTLSNVTGGWQVNYTIDNLEPFSEYGVWIRAYTSQGVGPHSPELVKRTGESTPDPPVLDRVYPISPTTIGVAWSSPAKPNGEIVNFTIIIAQPATRDNASVVLVETVSPSVFYKTVKNLTADTGYNVSVFAATSVGKGKSSDAVDVVYTPRIFPGAPQSLHATSLNSTAVLISWSRPEMGGTPDQYYVTIVDEVSGKEHSLATSNLSVVVPSLEPYTYYKIKVASHTNDINSISTTFIRMPEDTPGQVSVFSVVDVDDSSALLRWKVPNSPRGRIGYQYTVQKASTGEENVGPRLDPNSLQMDANETFYRRVFDLEGDTEYRFSVQAYNVHLDQEGPSSRWETALTKIGYPGPPAKVVVVGRRRSSNIYVAWEAPDKPNGPLEGYKVTVTWTGQGVQPPVTSVNYETHSTVNKQLEILGLQPGSQYLITVRARNTQNEEGVTSNPEAVWIRSDDVNSQSPSNVTISNKTATGFIVEWEQPSQSTNISNYRIYVTEFISGNNIQILNMSNSTYTIPVYGLKSNTLYGVQVEAVFGKGMTVSSEFLPVQTLQGAPVSPPRNFIVEVVNSTSLYLQWAAPPAADLNGILCGFDATVGGNVESFASRQYSGFLTNLNPWTNYSVTLQARTCAVNGLGPVATMYGRTAEDIPDKTTIKTQSSSNSSISFTWSVRPNGQLTDVLFTINSSVHSNSDSVTLIMQSGDHDLMVTYLDLSTSSLYKTAVMKDPESNGMYLWQGLEPFTEYTISVQAKTRVGAGNIAQESETTAEARPSTAPTLKECSIAKSQTEDYIGLTISYESLQPTEWRGDPLRYDIVIQQDGRTIEEKDTDLNSEAVVRLNQSLYNVSSVYYVTIAGVNDAGRGPFAQPPCNFTVDAPSITSSPQPSDSSNTTTVIAVVVSITIVLIVVIVAVFLWKRARSGSLKFDYSGSTQLGPGYFQVQERHWLADWPDFEKFQFDRNKIEKIRELGEGEFGKVYLASADGIVPGEEKTQVALKTMKKDSSRETAEDFRKEMDIMMEFDHPNIVKLLGVCTKEEPLYIITELMSKGDLKEFVRKARPSETNLIPGLTLDQLLDICTQLSSGMAYLACLRFVHRDVAARNCLVGGSDDKLIAKIADFGMAKDVYQNDYYKKRGGILPIRWMAPEAITDGRHTLNSDIWSFGVLMWEVFSFGYQPYFGIENDRVLGGVIQGSLRLQCPPGCPARVFNLVERCWEKKPVDRIRAADLESEMKGLCQLYDEQGLEALRELSDRYQGLQTVQSQKEIQKQVNGNFSHPESQTLLEIVAASYTNVSPAAEVSPVKSSDLDSVDHPTLTPSYVPMDSAPVVSLTPSYVPMDSALVVSLTPSYVPMDSAPVVSLPDDSSDQFADLKKQVKVDPNQYDEMPGGAERQVFSSSQMKMGGFQPEAPYTNVLPEETSQPQSITKTAAKTDPFVSLPSVLPSTNDVVITNEGVEMGESHCATTSMPSHSATVESGQISYVNVQLNLEDESVM